MPTEVRRRLRKIVTADRSAAAWLYDRFSGRLFRRLRVRYAELDPEQLLHDVYLVCLQGEARPVRRLLERFSDDELTEAQLERYLWDVACGIAANRRRAARQRRMVPLTKHEPAGIVESERRHLERDTLDRLDRCLRARRARIYVYFKLRYVEGLTPDEIARATGWSRKATYKFRQALNEAVRECAEEVGISVEESYRSRGLSKSMAGSREGWDLEELLWELSRRPEEDVADSLPAAAELTAYRRGELGEEEAEALEYVLGDSPAARARLFEFDGVLLGSPTLSLRRRVLGVLGPRRTGRSYSFVFVIATFALSWTIWLGLLLFAHLGLIAGDTPLRHYAWGGLAPSLVAMLLTHRMKGWAGVKRLMARARHWRVPLHWYAFALLVPFLIRLAGIALHSATGGLVRLPQVDPSALAVGLLVGLLVGLMEEFGWRGFLQPELRKLRGAVRAGILVGIAWWAWHLPLFWIDGTSLHEWQARSNLPVAMMVYAGAVIGLSMLFTFMYEHTGGSLLLAFLLHSATNTSADLFSGPYRAAGEMGPTWWNVIALIAVAMIVTWALGRVEGADRGVEEGGSP